MPYCPYNDSLNIGLDYGSSISTRPPPPSYASALQSLNSRTNIPGTNESSRRNSLYRQIYPLDDMTPRRSSSSANISVYVRSQPRNDSIRAQIERGERSEMPKLRHKRAAAAATTTDILNSKVQRQNSNNGCVSTSVAATAIASSSGSSSSSVINCDSTQSSSTRTEQSFSLPLRITVDHQDEEDCAVSSSTADEDLAFSFNSNESKSSVKTETTTASSSDAKRNSNETSSAPLSPQPGPSGLQEQQQEQRKNGLNADDLQLDCLSSDTEDSSPEEDVTVVKISRRRKNQRRQVVEVDLTQESDGSEENDIQVEVINQPSGSARSGGIKLRRFATAPEGVLPRNVHSSGNNSGNPTPSTTPVLAAANVPETQQNNVVHHPRCNTSSHSQDNGFLAPTIALGHGPLMEFPHGPYCFGNYCTRDCFGPLPSGTHYSGPLDGHRHGHHRHNSPEYLLQQQSDSHLRHNPYTNYRPRRLRHPEFFPFPEPAPGIPNVMTRTTPATSHAPNGCPDAHCRIHQNERAVPHPPPQETATSGIENNDQAGSSARRRSSSSSRSTSVTAEGTVRGSSAHTAAGFASTSATTAPTAHSQASTSHVESNRSPSGDQRLINAVWRMQYHPAMRSQSSWSRMHPRHQRMWQSHQLQQEMLRRHMGRGGNNPETHQHVHAPQQQPTVVPPPLPAHMSNPFPFGTAPEFVLGAPPMHHAPNPIGHHGHMMPFLLQPARYAGEDYFRIVEQRRVMENNRGASRGCIERNTFPHKFKKIQRLDQSKQKEEEEEVDKCTICLCGKI